MFLTNLFFGGNVRVEHKNLVYSLKVNSETLYNCEETPFALEYYMVQSKEKEGTALTYGVEIRKVVEGRVEEAASEYHIGRTFDRAKKLLDVLANNTVTPAGFLDLIEELEY